MNIWQTLKKPIFILAPMEDVTDTVFRQIILECGRPDLFFTEFTNVEGLASVGNKIVAQRLLFTPPEKPIIAQVWGKDPKHYFEAAKKIAAMGFDGVDINMGCPQKPIIKNGCCIALINNRPLASEIIHATQEGAAIGNIPVSLKTRIGWNTIVTEEWLSFLLSHNLSAITIHGRTAKEMSEVPAHWDEIGSVVALRNRISPQTILIGNGDVQTIEEAQEKVKMYGIDGVMIARGIFRNPFLFHPTKHSESIAIPEKFQVLTRHLQLFQTVWEGKKHYPIMKKYFKIYINGFDGASELREKLMETQTPEEALALIPLLLTAHTTDTNPQHSD